jgi:hypothetical protein
MKFIAIAILSIHLLWILAVIFGAAFTRGRPVWSGLHVVSLIWGIVVELAPIACPLTLAEQYFEAGAGIQPYEGSFIMHYLDKLIYPNLPWWVVASAGAGICVLNLVVYGRRFIAWRRARAARALA